MGATATPTQVASQLAAQLLYYGFKVQRYDAETTNSVYLKLDYGVCHSIRISDHEGKQHLKYRYIIRTDWANRMYSESTESGGKVYQQTYYGLQNIESLLSHVLTYRESTINNCGGYGGYGNYVAAARRKNATAKGFWQKAKELELLPNGLVVVVE